MPKIDDLDPAARVLVSLALTSNCDDLDFSLERLTERRLRTSDPFIYAASLRAIAWVEALKASRIPGAVSAARHAFYSTPSKAQTVLDHARTPEA